MQLLVALMISASAVPAPDPFAETAPHAAAAERAASAMLETLLVARANRAPVADAGPDWLALEGGGVELNGAASFDPDGDAISMQWVQTGGAPVALEPSARVANPAFEAPKADGRPLTFELRVTDRHGLRGVDSVVVTVTNGAWAPREETRPIRGEVTLARAGSR